MALPEPYPGLEEILASVGEAGHYVSELQNGEGAAGNISVFLSWAVEISRIFPVSEKLELPTPAPALAGKVVLVTGSGRRLRDIQRDPAANLGAVLVGADGLSGTLYTSPRRLFKRLTSELNSHLAVHNDQVARTGTNFQALVHAQPPHLVYLSHIPAYMDEATLNRRLMRWEPETIMQFPNGISVVPYMLPGSTQVMDASVAGLREHSVTLWSKHGVISRSDESVTYAADLIEYIEAAARFEFMDLVAGGKGEGLTDGNLREVAKAFNINSTIV